MRSRKKMTNRNSRLFKRGCFVWARAQILPLLFFPPRQLRKSDGFARTRRHLPKRIRFVIALVIFGRMPQPGIAQKSRIWPQRDTSFMLVSEMNLARGGFRGRWRHRGRMCFSVLFQKCAFRAHETSNFNDQNPLQISSAQK